MYPRSSTSTSCRSLWCPSLSLYLVLAWAPQLCWGIFQGSAPPTNHWPLQEISAYSCSSASILECHCTSGWWASWRHLRRGEDNSEVRLRLNVLCRLPGCPLDQRITKLLCLDTTSSNCFWFIGLSKPFIQTSHHVQLLATLPLLLWEKPVHLSSAGEVEVLGSCGASEHSTYIILPGMLCPEIHKHRRGVCLPMWFAWQIKVDTEAEAGNWCYN